jgi:hypothetical protein
LFCEKRRKRGGGGVFAIFTVYMGSAIPYGRSFNGLHIPLRIPACMPFRSACKAGSGGKHIRHVITLHPKYICITALLDASMP